MDGTSQSPKDASCETPAAHRFGWRLLLVGLLAWQGWMTLGLFGGDRSWRALLDDRPILSGRHPLHLYHGYLGARSLLERGNPSCYDPNFHAGYPKTPVFDGGSRPAELLLVFAGGRYCPAAYKLGLALVCLFAPLLLFAAARSVGSSRAASCLACALGQLVWWGQPCREALTAGEIDLLLATLLVLAQAGLLIRFHREPGPLSWLGVTLTALVAWFAHPLLMALMLPLILVYYLSVGTRHRLAWHAALLGGLLAALGVNGFWLIDWIGYWWIRVPQYREAPLLAHRTFRTVWEAPLWGGPSDRALACVLVIAAAVGALLYNGTRQRATARLLGLAWFGLLALSAAGLLWEPLGRLGSPHLLVPALLFACVPAAHALTAAVRLALRRRWPRWVALAAAAGATVFLIQAPPPNLMTWIKQLLDPAPLQLGLDAEQSALIETLRRHTTAEARILWEDHFGSAQNPHWTPLFPLLTERAFVGGLDAEAGIEYTANGLCDRLLAGRPVRDWSDKELSDYCERYNIGWVACWSPAACQRFAKWKQSEWLSLLPSCEGCELGCLYRIKRKHSFALIGSVQWLSADSRHIVLGHVSPSGGPTDGPKGQVLLSLHYQEGMRVAPSRVHIDGVEPPPDSLPFLDESIRFVRLRVEEPVTRVTITWDVRHRP